MSMLSSLFSVIIDHGISAPVHGIEAVDGTDAIEKGFLFRLISTVKLPVAKGCGAQMVTHTVTRTSGVSLAREFRKHLSPAARKHVVIDQYKYKIKASKKEWKEREYHVHEYSDDVQNFVKMCFSTNQFSSLSFCGPHTNPHGVRGLSKHYHI